jgi:hypothetical protein
LKVENHKLNKVLKECGEQYFGTHPVHDAEKMYRELWMKRHNLKKEDIENGKI